MRITNNMLINNMKSYIGNNLSRMERYQYQMATGKKISVPSDDPVVASRALRLRTDVAEIEQFKRNANDAMSWMELTESVTNELTTIMQRVRELAVQGSSGTYNQDDTQKISAEIEQLKNQVINLANSTYAGRYIFSGFKTDTKLLNDDGTFAIDVNNSESIEYEIGIGDSININVPGGDLFNGGIDAGSGNPAGMVQRLDEFIAYLDAGDNEAIGGMIGEIDNEISNLLRVRADIGARMNRVELSSNRLDTNSLNFTKLMSENEDVDMAETIMNLISEENVYRASLSAGAKIIMPTLVDFLK